LESFLNFLTSRHPDAGTDNVEFSDELRVVLQRTRGEAVRLSSPHVGTEQVVLGVLATPESEACRLFASVGLPGTELRSQLEAVTSASAPSRSIKKPVPAAAEIPWTGKAKQALLASVNEARELDQTPVTSGHLLLGVLADATSVAGRLLAKRGITLGQMRALIRKGVGPHVDLHIELDDTSDRLIYEQIGSQIREAIATGRLLRGQRLPPIRQLADELGIAPGTVARAYSGLETAGIVVTDRARGTFVAGPRDATSQDRPITIRDLLRPAVVAAFHLGSSAHELRAALEDAMSDIYPNAA
jgi:DNA-binding transcriptional regulator YhcF (GntR family)